MVLALLWQLAHAVLLAPVNVHSCTELESLLLPGEEHSAAPDELLFRWLNHHLHQGNRHERVASWTDPNLRSGVAYAVLLEEVAPRTRAPTPSPNPNPTLTLTTNLTRSRRRRCARG